MKKILENKKGYSLLEMIVAIAMFATIFLMVTSIYLSLLESQRSVIATQTIQESMKFILESASKEIRSAIKSDNTCETYFGFTVDAPAKKVFNIDSTTYAYPILYFENKDNECVAYFLEDDTDGITRLKIQREALALYVTPNDMNLTNLNFSVVDDDVGAFHSTQPTVTIRLDIDYIGSKNLHRQNTSLQTSVTSRYYE